MIRVRLGSSEELTSPAPQKKPHLRCRNVIMIVYELKTIQV